MFLLPKSAPLRGREMKYQGIVISIIKNKAIVSTDDFKCFYVKRRPTIYVGKQIEFTEKEIIRKGAVLTKLALSAACLAILFVIASFSNLTDMINIKNILSEPEVFAYVDVDINPSLEMEIDDKGNVLRLDPLNEDAKVLIKKLKFSNISVSKVIDNIIDEVKKNKDISEAKKDYILVSSTLNNKKNEDDKDYQVEKKKLDIIMNSLRDNIQENSQVNVYLVETNIYEREEARSEGISTGRYVLYNKYDNLRNSLSIEEAKNVNVNELLEGIPEQDSLKGNPVPTPSPLRTEDTVQNGPTKDPNIELNTPSPTTTLTSIPKPTITLTATPTLKPTATPIQIPGTIEAENYTTMSGIEVAGPSVAYINTGDYMDYNVKVASSGTYTVEFRASSAPGSTNGIQLRSGSTTLCTVNVPNTGSWGTYTILTANVTLNAGQQTLRVYANNSYWNLDWFRFTPTSKTINPSFMRFESYNYHGYYIRHQSFEANISPYVTPVEDSIFKIVPGLADPNCISFESKNLPGYYLKHENFKVILKQYDGTETFNADATFRKVPGLWDETLISFQSFNHPNRYLRHREFYLWIDEIVTDLERKDATYIGIKVE